MPQAARFLVVDDHAPLRHALQRALRRFGTVAHAGTVAAATKLITREAWSALFIDVVLPDGSGLDVLAFARAQGCTVPALVLTGSHDPATINRAFDLDARFLVKSSEWSHVESFVRSALSAEARLRETAAKWAKSYGLSPSETAILLATAQGSSREEVVDDRDIALATFKRHVANLLAKTQDQSLMHAAARLLREVGKVVPK